MEEVDYILGDEVSISFVVKGMRGEVYNIENCSFLSTVYMLDTLIAEITTYSAGWMFLYRSCLMRDNFAIEHYGLGDGSNVLLCPRLLGQAKTRITFWRLQIIIRDVSDTETN